MGWSAAASCWLGEASWALLSSLMVANATRMFKNSVVLRVFSAEEACPGYIYRSSCA